MSGGLATQFQTFEATTHLPRSVPLGRVSPSHRLISRRSPRVLSIFARGGRYAASKMLSVVADPGQIRVVVPGKGAKQHPERQLIHSKRVGGQPLPSRAAFYSDTGLCGISATLCNYLCKLNGLRWSFHLDVLKLQPMAMRL